MNVRLILKKILTNKFFQQIRFLKMREIKFLRQIRFKMKTLTRHHSKGYIKRSNHGCRYVMYKAPKD